jgi:beta-xylosidase
MFYSLDGDKWNKIENSVEVSAYHHNVLSGFLSLRLGLCSMGQGSVKFKNFQYKSMK